MAPFNRSYITYYQSATIALSCTIFELFDVEEYHYLEIRGYSRSWEIAPFDRLHTSSYRQSTVTIALSHIIYTSFSIFFF